MTVDISRDGVLWNVHGTFVSSSKKAPEMRRSSGETSEVLTRAMFAGMSCTESNLWCRGCGHDTGSRLLSGEPNLVLSCDDGRFIFVGLSAWFTSGCDNTFHAASLQQRIVMLASVRHNWLSGIGSELKVA